MKYILIENGEVKKSVKVEAGKVPKFLTDQGFEPANGKQVGMIDDGSGNFIQPAQPAPEPNEFELLKARVTALESMVK